MPPVTAARSFLPIVFAAVAAAFATAPPSPGGPGLAGPLRSLHAAALGPNAETTVELFPVADAFVDEADPDASFSTASAWPVERRMDGTVRRTLLRFDTSSVPRSVEIIRAELEVYLNSGSGGGPGTSTARINVDTLAAQWDSNGVTWTDRPAVGSIVAGLDVDTTPGPRTFDVGPAVVRWVRGTQPNHGVQLRGADGGRYVRLFRATGRQRPRLRIVYIDAGGTPSATPTATPTVEPAPSPTTVPPSPTTVPTTPPATDAPPSPTPRPADGSATPAATSGGAAGRALLPAVLCAVCRAAGTDTLLDRSDALGIGEHSKILFVREDGVLKVVPIGRRSLSELAALPAAPRPTCP